MSKYKSFLSFCVLFLFYSLAYKQVSIHIEQADYYKKLGDQSIEQYDVLNGYKGIEKKENAPIADLDKIVFGYHPYWGGSRYLN